MISRCATLARAAVPSKGRYFVACSPPLVDSSRNRIPAIPLRTLDRPALTACGGYAIGWDFAAINQEESTMADTTNIGDWANIVRSLKPAWLGRVVLAGIGALSYS